MITDQNWGRDDDNALYCEAKAVFSVLLRNFHLRILDRLGRFLGSPLKEVLNLEVRIANVL